MTVVRGVTLSLVGLLASAWLVGFCDVVGLLVWLAAVALGLAMPDATLRLLDRAASVRWHHVASVWAWLDRR